MKYLIFILITFISCQNTSNVNKKQIKGEKGDSIKTQAKSTIDTSEIQGAWADYETKRPIFVLKGDTIYYFEHPDRIKYKVIGDTFIIYFDWGNVKNKIIKLDADSLVYDAGNYINRYYRIFNW